MKKLLLLIAYWFANRFSTILENAQRSRLTKRFRSCGNNISLYMPICIQGADNVILGDDVAISSFVHMWGDGGIRIGNRVMIASHTAITTLTHDYREERMQGTLLRKEVVIEDDVWIGAHCTIMPGIRIGKGAVVGAGSVVTRNVEPYAIVIGSPARVWKYRDLVGMREDVRETKIVATESLQT